MPAERKPQVSGPVERNIRSIAEMEQGLEQNKGRTDRLAGAVGNFAGSMPFIALHLVWFTLWFLINTNHIHAIHAFDPYPFPLLSMAVSTEAVLLSTFVLMKQNQMQTRTDHRDQLNLQIDLLTEKELTKALQLLRALCLKHGVGDPLEDAELSEMSQITSVGTLAERIVTDLPPKA